MAISDYDDFKILILQSAFDILLFKNNYAKTSLEESYYTGLKTTKTAKTAKNNFFAVLAVFVVLAASFLPA